MRFANRVALVTGSSRGIGRAIALRLAGEGADIAVNYSRSRDQAEGVADEIRALGRRAHAIKANVGEIDDLQRLVDETEAALGGLDILVNNAASGYIRPVMEQRVKGWDWTMDINARAALFLAQAAVPAMRRRGGGRIVNITSLGSTRVLPEYVVIGASKAALEAVTRYMGVELVAENIIVNAVSGGVVETDALRHFPRGEQMLAAGRERSPAGRNITPEDVAATVAFLCSDDASMIVGQVIVVDGGYSIVA